MKTNRYARKKRHKRKMEEEYATKYWFGCPCNVKLLRDKLKNDACEDNWYNRRHPPRNNGWEYWKIWYISGARQYAKKYSDKRIRQKYRQMIRKYDPDDVTAPKGADYEKEYDYNWTVW